MLLLAFPELATAGDAVAKELGCDLRIIDLHRFPDGESLVTLPENIAGRDVAILCTLRDPDRLALPLRFAAVTARELGANHVGLIAPYLGYMRQDRRFAPGQAISAPLFAEFIEESFDWVVTVDPHLHRIPVLDRLFSISAKRIAAAPLIADWIAAEVPDAVLLGPDSESQQWVNDVAALVGRPFEVLQKVRTGDKNVEISMPHSAALRDGTPVILDDIASSGRTMVQAIERLVAAGTRPPVCLVIHAVFAGSAHDDILAAGAARIVSTNTIPHPSNVIDVSGLLARASIDLIGTRKPASRLIGKETRDE
ncbi:ribose-phosphate diphosphokinase [Thalassobius aquimarinus]|uniref:Ribose-phosphate diphosphokinase n=1 Tax=Thalassovita aquimarina TaxID=2785917 RepID=A0ABS5HX46_9RHOB|nr:ribose-phosphate diphosphokinase [Thalassovita aquimarina]MBR9653543.1 ribose-phosphate diphosphokinase [Thalassovita aquimarina]